MLLTGIGVALNMGAVGIFGKKASPLMTVLMVAILVGVGIALYFGGGPHRGLVEESRTRVMFDTVVRVTLEGQRGFDFVPVFEGIWAELSGWEAEVDAYDTASALFFANRSDSAEVLPDRLSKALRLGFESILSTGGNFDIRIGELTSIWDFAGDGRVPSKREISAALDRMHRPIRLSGDTLVKSGASPKLDLGGLAKGMAADAVYALLDTIPEIERFIVDLGGNIRAKSSDSSSFEIGIQDPRSANRIAARFSLGSGFSCATAGDYQRYFIVDGIRYHHILDPATGAPARRCSAVTVVARDGATADIMSTALFVMGPVTGMEFLKEKGGIEAAFFDSTGTLIAGNLDCEKQ